ncbi:hypothetical protein BDZ94DRAFT_733362 [Collybia nuda]|uniref:Uncharacterized protein n=1 Tax=Collybia nuda TaxID=64659 RepID=A0A9P5Y5Y9_9AGAR|nr:hypothetical protein BDZ94DRAFT_733362 [Collybia nuda]
MVYHGFPNCSHQCCCLNVLPAGVSFRWAHSIADGPLSSSRFLQELMSPPEDDLGAIQLPPLVFFVVPVIVQTVFYGVYITLFCQCIYIFRKRHKGRKPVLVVGTVLMFVFSTIQWGLGISCSLKLHFEPLENLIYVFANLIADSLLTFRCYVIWDYRKGVVIIPLALIIAGTVMGIYTTLLGSGFSRDPIGALDIVPFDPRSTVFITLATNIVLTLLSAGRIWWISRELWKTVGPGISKTYNAAIALIIESGAIYCASIIAYLVAIMGKSYNRSSYSLSADTVARAFFGILTQIVGIIPTLIVVRMGLGITTEDVQSVVLGSGINFRHSGSEAGQEEAGEY